MIVLSFDTGGKYLNALTLFGDQGLEFIALLRDRCIHCLNVVFKLTESGSSRCCCLSSKLTSRRIYCDYKTLTYHVAGDASDKRGGLRAAYPDSSGFSDDAQVTDIDIITFIREG